MTTIAQRPAIATLATDDELAVADTSATVTGKASLTTLRTFLNIYYGQLAAANTFTALQTFAPAAGIAINAIAAAGSTAVNLPGQDNGAAAGPMVAIGSNTNATTPAPGALVLQKCNPLGNAYLWFDDASNLRTLTNAAITSANRNAGTVVGTQTSSLDAKQLIGGLTSIEDVLAAVQRGAEAVRRFTYKSGAFNGEEFEGVVVDYEPRYGMDRDEEHEAGKSLNLINAVGDLLRAVAWLVDREQARGQ